MALLYGLPVVLVETTLTFLDHKDLHAIEQTSRVLASVLSTGRTWEERARCHAAMSDDDTPIDFQGWRRLACVLMRPSDGLGQLLTDVLAWSSMDREEESPDNTLKLSPCWRLMQLLGQGQITFQQSMQMRAQMITVQQVAQHECGCFRGEACYWSTTGSEEKNIDDYIEYSVQPKSRVDLIEIIPYCAYWQPDAPTYGPVAISIAFYQKRSPDTNTSARRLIYQSPVYPLPNEMKPHTIRLPRPVWLPHGAVMRLQLLGRNQHGTFDIDSHLFYTTLSYVGAVGLVISDENMIRQSRRSKVSFILCENELLSLLERPLFSPSSVCSTRSISRTMNRVDALPAVLLENVLQFLSNEELFEAEMICHGFHSTVQLQDIWQQRVRTMAAFHEDEAPTSPHAWKHLACLVLKQSDGSGGLLTDVIACSSVDRPVETPTNTLTMSRCWINLCSVPPSVHPSRAFVQHIGLLHNLGRVAQLECGCFRGPACYWSSAPSRDKNTVDFIDYTVRPHSLVRQLQIMPYRAYWHPHSPTYGPIAVSLSFFRHPIRQHDSKRYGELIYESPLFSLENEMKLQVCALPMPVWLPNGAILRLNLIGRNQIQPFHVHDIVPDNEGDYYTTLSFVNAVGDRVPAGY